jgi:predicted ATPase
VAEAIAIEEQVRAYGGPKFQVTQQVMKSFADAIAQAKVDVVPKVVMGENGKGSGSVLETLLALMLSERLDGGQLIAQSPEAARLKRELMASLTKPEEPAQLSGE